MVEQDLNLNCNLGFVCKYPHQVFKSAKHKFKINCWHKKILKCIIVQEIVLHLSAQYTVIINLCSL